MADKKISELDLVAQINNDAEFPMSQDNAGTPTTYKTKITDIGAEIAEDMTFSNLATQSKKIIGAINEILGLGSTIILGTSAPTSSQGSDGNIYVQYTAGTGGADDTVDALFVKLDGAWCEIETGGGSGSGGHVIVDEDGTSLAQRANLQFNGAYLDDNSGDDTTEVNVVRSMPRAQFNQLTADEKTGLINVTDESLNATEIPITDGSATNTKAYIDSRTINDLSNVVITSPTANDLLARNSGNTAWVNISPYSLVKTKIVEATTTSSGAIAHGIDLSKHIILYGTSTDSSSADLNRFAFLRSSADAYMTVFQGSAGSNPPFFPLVNTAVKITIFYI